VASTEKVGAEIGKEALGTVGQPAGTRERSEHEVLDEAVFGFLAFLRGRRRDEGFPALLDQISSRFDPGEDEALELGNEELRAFRGKRR
jgi:hypothetical protein